MDDHDPIQGHRGIFTRRNFMRLTAASVAGSFANAAWIEPNRLTITRQEMPCKKLPPALDGLRICLLADFHFRPDQDDELLAEAVAQANKEKPDLIALAGDFADAGKSVLRPLLRELEKLQASHGVIAVMGNHDGWNSGREVTRQHFQKAGISFLINQHSQLRIHGESLAVAGTDFVWAGKPDAARTLKGITVGTPILALVHEPDYFDTMTGHRDIMLQLSGHTHGGQCRVPFTGYAPVGVRYGRKYIYGGFSQGNSSLFVTRGVGTTGLRVRFACPPELAVLTLRSVEVG